MRRSVVACLLAAILSGTAASGARAQGNAVDSNVVDRILAVVGTRAILKSQVTEEVYRRVGAGKERVPDPAKDPGGFDKAMALLSQRYRDTLVAFELLHVEALADTAVKVTEQEVNEAVDQLVSNARKNYKTELEFKAQLKESGFATVEEWRKSLVEPQRRAITVSRYTTMLRDDGRIKERTPTAREIRAFYDQHINDFGQQPANLSFKQIVVAPKPSDSSRARAKRLADSLVVELRKGADFAVVARAFSMDEGSKADGGNLDWFPHGKMLREFEDAAFSLKPGTISEPVESPYGFHIIQVQRVQPGEVQARHILIIPDVDSAAANAAHERANEIVAALNKGALFDSLQHLYHDRIEELELNNVPMDTLSKSGYGPALVGVDSGKVSAPLLLPVAGNPLRSKWAVLQVTRRVPAGPPPFDDMLKGYIKRLLGTMLGEQDYINKLRARTYVDIRDP